MLKRTFKIEGYVESKSVLDLIAKEGRDMERRLKIDVTSIRESCENGELYRIEWIPGS